MQDSIAKQVFAWIRERPYIIYALKKNLINFSSLTREIQKDLEIKNFDAVIAATRRYRDEIKLTNGGKNIINIIKRSRLEVKTGMVLWILFRTKIHHIKTNAY